MRNQSESAGALAHSMQSIGGDIVYLDDRGLTVLGQAQEFGNFKSGAIDRPVRRYVQTAKPYVNASCISRDNDEYRLFIRRAIETDVLTATFGRTFDGFAQTTYPILINCICSLEDDTGAERIFAGADDGFVYELDKGTSFNGAAIYAYLKTAFNHLGSPSHKSVGVMRAFPSMRPAR